MTQIEEITSLPRNFTEELCERSLEEFRVWGLISFGAMKRAAKAWRITIDDEPLLYAMVYRGNLWGRPELGLYLCKRFVDRPRQSIRAAMALRKQLREMFPSLKAHVAVGHETGLRFARFFGFRVICKTEEYYLLED